MARPPWRCRLARLRHHDAALTRPAPLFPLDPRRLYDVGEDGRAYTAESLDDGRQDRLRHQARLWWIVGTGSNGLSMAAAALGFALGGRALGAGLGLCVLATLPLLAVAPWLQWRSRRVRHRAHARRPESFSRG